MSVCSHDFLWDGTTDGVIGMLARCREPRAPPFAGVAAPDDAPFLSFDCFAESASISLRNCELFMLVVTTLSSVVDLEISRSDEIKGQPRVLRLESVAHG